MFLVRTYLLLLAVFFVFQNVATAQPTTAEEFHESCKSFIQKKIFLSAVRDCTRSIELKPGNAKVIFNRSTAYDGVNDSWNSLQDLNAVIKLTPQDTVAIGQRALLHLKMYEYDLAVADMTRILELKPNDPPALFQRALVYEKLNKRDLARADLQQLLQLYPSDKRIKDQLTWLDSTTKPTQLPVRAIEGDLNHAATSTADLEKLKQKIAEYKTKQLATEAELAAAIRLLYDSFDKKSPQNALYSGQSRRRDYYDLVGACLFRFPANVFCNAVALDLSTETDRPYTYQGSLLQKYYTDRATLVNRLLLANSANYPPSLKLELLHNLELSYMTTENYPRSVEMANEIEKLGAKYLDRAYRARYRANAGLKKYDLALADLNRLIALKEAGKTTAWVRMFQRAEILNDANRPAEAIKAANDALIKEPDEWQATMQKARALRLQKKYPQALAEIEKVFAKYPNAMYIRSERSMIYRGMGDLTKAYADEAIATRSVQSN